jgi:hypothetical protein
MRAPRYAPLRERLVETVLRMPSRRCLGELDLLDHIGGVLIIAQRESGPLPLKAVDVAVEREKRVYRGSWGEPGLKQCAKDPIRVRQSAETTVDIEERVAILSSAKLNR